MRLVVDSLAGTSALSSLQHFNIADQMTQRTYGL